MRFEKLVVIFLLGLLYLGETSKLNLSQILTEPSKRISYTVGDHLRHFAKQTLLSLYIKHNNPIPPTDGANGFLRLSEISYKCFPTGFCHSTLRNSPVRLWCLGSGNQLPHGIITLLGPSINDVMPEGGRGGSGLHDQQC